MDLIKTNSFILNSIKYGEADRIITFFTEKDGKVKIFAKSAYKSKKRFGPVLDFFNEIEIEFAKKDSLSNLRSASLSNYFPNIRDDLKKFSFANYFLEVLNELLPEHEAHKEIYSDLSNFLARLNDVNPPVSPFKKGGIDCRIPPAPLFQRGENILPPLKKGGGGDSTIDSPFFKGGYRGIYVIKTR